MALVPITRSDFEAAMDRALRMGFFQEPSDVPRMRQHVFKSMTSDQRQEKFSRNSGFGMFTEKPEGTVPDADTASQMYDRYIFHKTYAKEMAITMEARQDDPKGVIKRVWETGADLRGTMEYTLEYLHWGWINDHWTSFPVGDPLYTYNGTGYPILSLVHPTANNGQTYPNRFANAAQLNRATLSTMIQNMVQQPLNERGMKQMWVGGTLIVGVGNMMTARYIVRSTDIPQTADNGPNVNRDYVREVIAPPLFQDNGAWGLLCDTDKMGFLTFLRMGLETEALSMDATLNTKKVPVFRIGYGGVHPKGIYGSPAA